MLLTLGAQQARDEAREKIEEAESNWLRRLERCHCPRPLLDRTYYGFVACGICGLLTRVWSSALKRKVPFVIIDSRDAA